MPVRFFVRRLGARAGSGGVPCGGGPDSGVADHVSAEISVHRELKRKTTKLDHPRPRPSYHWLAAVRASGHLLGARATGALMATREGEM